MTLLLALIPLGILAYVGWTIYSEYKASAKTGWQRWLDAAEGSATILWAKFVMGVGAVTGALTSLADYFNEPSISSTIQSVLKPQYVAVFVVFIGIITVWARKRTL